MLPSRTPLYDQHLALGARMVDFAGWEMPLHYGSQVDEHHAVRRAAGMFDVSHMLGIDVSGPDARPFLRHVLANDVSRLATTGSALYSCMLNAAGGVVDDLIVYQLGDGQYRCVVNAGCADKDVAWLAGQARAGRFDVVPGARRDLAMIAIQGPHAREAFWQARPALRAATGSLGRFEAALPGSALVGRTGYTGEDGFEVAVPGEEAVSLWRSLLAAGVRPCGLGARDTLRLEAGMNLYGTDMDESTTPIESGLAWTVDLSTPRAFVGRLAVEGQTPSRVLVGLRLLERGVMRAHMPVRTRLGEGVVTSGTYSPTLGFSIGLARLPSREGALPVPGERVSVAVRDRWLPAEIVKPPFVRNGRSLVPPASPDR